MTDQAAQSVETDVLPSKHTSVPHKKKLIVWLLGLIGLIILFVFRLQIAGFVYHKTISGFRTNTVIIDTDSEVFDVLKTQGLSLKNPSRIILCQSDTYIFALKIISRKISSTDALENTMCLKHELVMDGSFQYPTPYTKEVTIGNIPIFETQNSIPSKDTLIAYYYGTHFWEMYENMVGFPTGDGRFVRVLKPTGGITLLPEKYVEKKVDTNIEIVNTTGKKKQITIAKQVLELTFVRTFNDPAS